MTQSTNARPCNCDQALKLEALLERSAKTAEGALRTGKELSRTCERTLSVVEALQLTCAAQGRKLSEIERILCALTDTPCMSAVPPLRDNTLESIRLAMIDTPW